MTRVNIDLKLKDHMNGWLYLPPGSIELNEKVRMS